MARAKAQKTPQDLAQAAEAADRLARLVQAARREIADRRQARGTGARDVMQEDVDTAAEALVKAGIRPYPQLVGSMTGGSLSTVGPKFEDWWVRFAARRLDPDQPGLELPLQIALRVRHLIAGLEAAVREQLRGRLDPPVVFRAAAELGERQALRAQIAALEATREKLTADVAALTFKVSELEAGISTQATARQAATTALEAHLSHLTQALSRLQRRLDQDSSDGDRQLLTALQRLRTQLKGARHRRPAPPSRPRRPTASSARSTARSQPRRATRTSRTRAARRGARQPAKRHKR